MSDTYSRIPQPYQNIGCQDLLKEAVSISGWVRKRHFANKLRLFRWPKVYMVISKGCIYYFRNEYCKSVSGKFSLFGFNSVTRVPDVKESEVMHAFKIDHTHKDEFKSYYFGCSSENEMKMWMKKIKEELKIANDSGKRDGDYYYTQGNFGLKQTPETQGSSSDSGFGPSGDGDTVSMTSYREIEESIYDDPSSFKPPEDYGLYAKKANEASDDEDIPVPPPIPARVARKKSADKEKKKKRRRKKEEIPDHHASTDSRSGCKNEAQELAKALSSEMENLFGKKNFESTEPTSSPRSSKKSKQAPPEQQVENEDEDEDEDEGDKYWNSIYFEGEKEGASEIIRNIGEDGVFLVRSGEGGKVLVVFAENMPKKYKIQCQNEQFYLAQTGPKAETLEELLFEYFTTNLPNTSVTLTTPYSLHSSYN